MTHEYKQTLARKIRTLRKKHRLTQEKFAERIQVHPSYIGPMEKGFKVPSVQILDRIAEAFEIPLYELFIPNEEERAAGLYINKLSRILNRMDTDEQEFVLNVARNAYKTFKRN